MAGRRAGLAGERSGLFHQFMRLVGEIAPRWVVIENVPGLLSSQRGRDMGIVLGILADLGYGWCYRVLDAQYFGVAQRRRRVFIVGCLGDAARAAQVLLEPESCDGDSPPSREAGSNVADSVAACLNSGGNAGGFRTEPGEHLIPETADTLRSHPRPGSNSNGAIVLTVGLGSDPIHARDLAMPVTGRNGDPGVVAYPLALRGRENGTQMEMGEEGVYNALRAGSKAGDGSSSHNWVAYSTKLHNTTSNQAGKFYEEYTPSLQADSPPPAVAFAENQRGELREFETPTLTTGGGKPGQGYPAVRQDMAVRRLIPEECERLQGFPDGWTEGAANSRRYRMLGNAVCVPVATWIGRRIVEATAREEESDRHVP